MKLLTDELRAKLPPLDSAEWEYQPIALARFYTPDADWVWFPTAGSPIDGDFEFFGYVEGMYPEWGYFRLSELENIRGKKGLLVMRDLFFTPKSMAEYVRW
jgi:hypothetical protein